MNKSSSDFIICDNLIYQKTRIISESVTGTSAVTDVVRDVTIEDSGKTFFCNNAAGKIRLNLPAAATVGAGWFIDVVIVGSFSSPHDVKINSSTGDIFGSYIMVAGAIYSSTAGTDLVFAQDSGGGGNSKAGDYGHIICDGVKFNIRAFGQLANSIILV